MDASPHIFDATLATFEQDVILKSKQVPVLVDFWASWCGPCKSLGPVLEKLAAEFAGGFILAKVDVDTEQQLAGYFQVKSIPTVVLLKDGQIVDGFPGALREGELREFLRHHGVSQADPVADTPEGAAEPEPERPDPHAEVLRLRAATQAEPARDELKLELALALLATGAAAQARELLDALPANLATDERAVRAQARLGFHAQLADAPPRQVLEAAIAVDPADLRARHLLGVRLLLEGEPAAGLEQFLEMLRRDRGYQEQLPKRSLIDAFRIIEDADLVGAYRRRMASMLF
ncbi:MAG: thioredoxin [Arenimonas sp.]